ncbi:MAG: hypothetical protein SGILL_003516 [Bacillariaceae sp.]
MTLTVRSFIRFIAPIRIRFIAPDFLHACPSASFPAPSNRAAAVGNVVQAKKPSVFGVAVPPFVAKAFGVRYEGDKVSDIDADRMETMMMEIDEECYLGKDGDLDECADFDP